MSIRPRSPLRSRLARLILAGVECTSTAWQDTARRIDDAVQAINDAAQPVPAPVVATASRVF